MRRVSGTGLAHRRNRQSAWRFSQRTLHNVHHERRSAALASVRSALGFSTTGPSPETRIVVSWLTRLHDEVPERSLEDLVLVRHAGRNDDHVTNTQMVLFAADNPGATDFIFRCGFPGLVAG